MKKTDSKVVQVRDLLLVDWSPEEWEKLSALLIQVAHEQASNQTNSPEPLGTSALKNQTPSGPGDVSSATEDLPAVVPPEGFSVEEWEEVRRQGS